MKRLLVPLALLLGSCATTAPETQPVVPDGTPTVDGDVTYAEIGGMLILVKRVPGAELAAGQLYLKGGVRNWDAATAGIEELALSTAVSGGTQKLDKDAFTRKLAALGTDLGSESTDDYGAVMMKALAPKWDESFALLADAFLQPALPASEIELNRQRQLSGLHHELETPDGRLSHLAHETLFKGHPYQNRAEGTIESVTALKAEQLAPHLQKLRETSRMLFVAVGDLDALHVIDQVKAAFGALPRGNYVATPIPRLSFAKSTLTVDAAVLPTNYIEAVFPGPAFTDPDFAAGLVAMNHLSDRLFEEVRTKRNLSYAPHARLGVFSEVPLGSLYVTAVDPNTTLKVMYDQAHLEQTKPISEKSLAGAKSTFLTAFLEQSESMNGLASFLANAQIYGGDWKRVRDLPDQIHAVTAPQVQAFARKYFVNAQVLMVGDPTKLDPAIATSL